MADVIKTKTFRNGGSLAVRIPAGWVDADKDLYLSRDRRTGRIFLSQDRPVDPNRFFDFVKERGYQPDAAFAELENRDDRARPVEFED